MVLSGNLFGPMKRILILVLTFSVLCLPLEARRRWIPKASTSAGYNPLTDTHLKEMLDAIAITGATNGSNFTPWQATVGVNAVQATTANQPVYNTGVKNGHPAVTFAVVTGNMAWMTVSTFGTIAQNFEVWVVGRFDSVGVNNVMFDGVGSSNRAAVYTASTDLRIFAGSDVTTGLTSDTNWHIWHFVFAGSSTTVTVDGGSPTSGLAAGSNSLVGLTIGSLFDQGIGSFVTMGKIMVRDEANTQNAAILSYLNTEWNVY